MTSEHSISRKDTPWFYDELSAIDLLRSIRWENGVHCPRCGSRDVRDVKTERSLEVLSCRDCRYNFNTAADTYFHGSKIPISAQLGFLVALALEPETSASRLSRFLGWKTTTVSRQLARLGSLRAGDFVSRSDCYKTFERFPSIVEFMEQPAITVRPHLLRERLSELLANRGQSLRRGSSRPNRPARPASEPAIAGTYSFARKGQELTLPGSREYLLDEEAAFNLVNTLRWPNQKHSCPRCKSGFVQAIRTKNPRQLYRCVDCTYMFSSLSGTIFHASKIPIRKHLQLFVLQNALGKDLSLQDTCYALGCTRITASRLLERAGQFATEEQFSMLDKRVSDRIRIDGLSRDVPDESFRLYCESKGILLYEAHFIEYLRAVCRTLIW